MSEAPIRIAVVGLGKIARDQHLPAIGASSDFELVAVIDPFAEDAEGAPLFSDFDALAASGIAVDAAAICTPPKYRAALASEALERGFHVMLEKPPAATVAEAEELIRLAEKQRQSLFAAWHSREAYAVESARRWLEGQEINSVAITWREDVRVWHPGQKWIFEEGGFGVFDPAINAFSIVSVILPGSLTVTGARLDIPANCAAPIAGNVTMEGEDGLPVSLDMDFLQTGEQTWDIAVDTDEGAMLLSMGGSRLRTPEGELEGEDAEYPALYARFAELVRQGQSDVDLTPLALVEIALAIGERREVEPFVE
ncbi:Gfo/Idh/MocA family protein [Qipengyuania atrilutea]|uniref:Gfo/Idh/MocA family oxidoreductase n=1 Tax=Qipengyuania atrilutea TaxID=2744473 RepID=A0A850H4G8_9SPHN|nr:Gfo/Idh/MocA family oxidoreductase [Actirhodobacter atriluteus]NVD45082.1 Gfo/Idh/MocA family oxidoreductase [Actirhodobacter atriluteus]